MLNAIFATDMAHGFGYENRLPWPRVRSDMAHFQQKTNNNIIVMGKNTYKSLPTLPNRKPIVITSDKDFDVINGVAVHPKHLPNLKEFSTKWSATVFVIGGKQLLTLDVLKQCDTIYHTTIKDIFKSDVKIDDEVMEYLKTRKEKIIAEDQFCIIREYSEELS